MEPSRLDALSALARASGLPFRLHAHQPTRTMGEARENLDFDPARIVKTVAFATRAGVLVLAALPGVLRVDYARLARACGVNRRDLAALAPGEVLQRVGVEPGGVSPLHGRLIEGTLLLVDEAVLGLSPTAYCGAGRPDRTFELAPEHLLAMSGGRVAAFSRPAATASPGAPRS